MNIRTVRGQLGAGVVAALTAGMLAMGASPAPASTSDGYVSGKGAFADDWNDEGTLSTSSYSNSGATCLWQRILEAEGYTLESGPDGLFGFETKAATRRLQVRWGLADSYDSADGKVGPNTFGRAGKNLTLVSTGPDEYRTLKYNGRVYSFKLDRSGYGNYLHASGSRVSYTSNPC